MKVALITRTTLYSTPGGDTIQIQQTASQLKALGIDADVLPADAEIDYERYDLLHFFNITRPADILQHQRASGKPSVISTILVDYSEFDRKHRPGLSGIIFNLLPADSIEYLKAIARFVRKKDKLNSVDYLWKGQRRSMHEVLSKAALILPNSHSEYRRIVKKYGTNMPHMIVPNGINPELFVDNGSPKDENLVLCVARIEGLKNQLNLIRALNNTRFRLLIIGAHSANQLAYYEACRREAAANVQFIDHIPQQELLAYYQRAKVHVLPSWFETTGLSSLEAAAMGCNLVITDKGDTRDYFSDDAWYCDPQSTQSIYDNIVAASRQPYRQRLRQYLLENCTWQQAARITLNAYQTILSS
ncbi:glycosyltransferase involved in cell wall biosynthesis [Mucilaginibacter yixingensis]|uniref:Glycosyltransferase involved in cell wall biosynthesis n=1 Tax=Mucilaginibacter yixingensis TaxID=1295612 RepID=A0A2T5J7N7_9SPHI|nr:glycosyltransferase family 4 protein [Mucilaginibacter yixingensis]PTQ95129.1 glycosyltransferase involved in cell wall biosynthesis [Mucilaginibacter yixingensis]